jgi:hypothetical protein
MSSSSALLEYAAIAESSRLHQSPNPLPYVALHELCTNCTQFCIQWEVVGSVQISSLKTDIVWPYSHLCTVAHLLNHQAVCHLCSFLIASFRNSHKLKSLDVQKSEVYLHPQQKEDGKDQIVHANVADELTAKHTDASYFGAFVLKIYHCQCPYMASLHGDLADRNCVDPDVGGFHQHITARSVPCLAQDNLERAKSWIETCLSEHEKCHTFHHNTVQQNDRRPTRVLEVSDSSVKLRCDMAAQNFDYLALSHMWGDPSAEHLKLQLDNIDHFRLNIPWHKLSSIYEEAIRVTLALGYKYLWIDSLCIIQDSATDWKYEASLMAAVYGNSACNLAFLFPSLSPETATRSDPRVWNPCILRAATPSQSGVYIQHYTGLLRATYQTTEPQDWLIQRNWPLFSRAWTFQEYLLSPRTLLLGHKNLLWQCSRGFYDELLGPIAEAPHTYNDTRPKRGRDMGKSRYFPAYFQPGFSEDMAMSAPKSLAFMLDWQALVTEYRTRELSFAKDRVIAFAGIARAFRNLGSLTYLAGAWGEFFPLCLLWYVDKKAEATVRRMGIGVRRGGTVEYPVVVKEGAEQEAPTWSQFSVPVYTHHQTYFVFNDDEVFVRSKSFESSPRVCWDDIYWTTLDSFQFGEEVVDYFPETGFFDFTNLRATLNMPVLPVRVSWPTDLEERFGRIRATDPQDAEIQWKPDFAYYPNIPGISCAPPKRGVLALVTEFQICRLAGKYNIQRRLAGLVLVRGEQEGTWKRVGAWKLRIKISDVEVNETNVKEVAERWKKYSTWTIDSAWRYERVTLI